MTPLYVALDVDYRDCGAVTAAVMFADWTSSTALRTLTSHRAEIEPYQPGEFYKRELPCLLAALELLPHSPTLVIIDGYVWLPQGLPGLGARLWEALGQTIPVVGVAKNPWRDHDIALPVLRGGSQRPLFVTAAGTDPVEAARGVESMHGSFRHPTLLKLADSLCRTAWP